MGIFGSIFGKLEPKEEKKLLPWQRLNLLETLDAITESSKTKPQVIFKHSTRCGISRMVLSQFESSFNFDFNGDLYYLDLLNHRDISNEISARFSVMHQSPQLLVIKNGVTVAHASHSEINTIDLGQFI